MELTTKETIAYIKHVVDIESSIYQQTKAKEEIKMLSASALVKPVRETINEPVDLSKELKPPLSPEELCGHSYHKYSKTSKLLGLATIFAFGAVMISFISFQYYSWGEGTALKYSSLVLLLFLIGYLLCKDGANKDKKALEKDIPIYNNIVLPNYEKEKKDLEEQYNKEMEEYRTKVNEALHKYKNELDLFNNKTITFGNEIVRIESSILETEKVLELLYAKDIIFPKYRNMIAMCTIYEYFASGRVSTLEGPDGAYNLYEQELRQNLIINNLSKIIGNLEQIKDNQYIIYTEISKTNEVLRGISSDIKGIANSTEYIAALSTITAMCTASIALNTDTLTYLGITGKL